MNGNFIKTKEKKIGAPLPQHSEKYLAAKITGILCSILLICFLFSGCQKTKEPEPKKEVKAQKEEAKQPEVVTKETPKVSEPVTKAEEAKKEQLSPLERAKGKEIIQDGQPIITWGSLKDLPTLDEVFPVVDKPPQVIEQPKSVEKIQLPETEERKKLRKNIRDETYDKLDAIKSPNGKCIIEFYGGTLPGGKREDWLRSIDPETKEVLWKYDEPGLATPEPMVEFSQDSDYFILTNLFHDPTHKWGIKLFSYKKGYLKDVYLTEDNLLPPNPMGRITSDGKNILVATKKGELIYFDIKGELKWRVKIGSQPSDILNAYDISPDGKYIFVYMGVARGKDIYCCADYILFETATGSLVWQFYVTKRLGDAKSLVGYYGSSITQEGKLTGIWMLNGPDYVLDKTDPYANVLLLVTKNDEKFAFRLQSLGFTFSDGGRYIFANSKYYDLQPILSKEMGGRK